MKNFLFASLLFFLLISCTKEEFLIEENIIKTEQQMARLTIMAAEILNTNPENDHACEPKGIPHTSFGLFYERVVSSETNLASADYQRDSESGTAYFDQLKPGMYSILTKNELGNKAIVNQIEIGSNSIVIEYKD